jgi:signal transduction histidine kinase
MKNWFNAAISNLRKYYPPFRNLHFWAVQFLAIPIAALHLIFVNTEYFSHIQGLYFIPITLLVVPVIYAALTFGFAGSVGTAAWVVFLSIPNLIFGPPGLERVGEVFQLTILVTMAIFMGQRVDRDSNSRKTMANAIAALATSETKYRGLFDSSPLPVLLLDKNNIILDANPSAGILLKKSPDSLKGLAARSIGFTGVLDTGVSSKDKNWWETNLVMNMNTGTGSYLEPIYTKVKDIQGNIMTQVILRDVTEEHRRQEGLKAYTAYMLRAQEEERQHIARELHDETIQTLALLCRQLDTLDTSSKGISVPFTQELANARKIAEKAVEELRDFSRALRPPILDDLGAVASIRQLLVDFNERTGVNGQFQIVGEEKRLSRDIEVGIYRIAQEALWNVEHHSKASKVKVTIIFSERDVVLNISDDGIGFDVPAVIGISDASSRLGLVGMRERTDIFGGKLEINSKPGQGTIIVVHIPIPESNLEN